MRGYKATDKDMKCRGFQFELGVWYETEEPLELCKSGFHFCKYPSGVHSYYGVGCRVFEIEAEGVLALPETPGANYKLVCSKIKLTKEIFPTGHYNTGNSNTGDRNTGNSNTGDYNTGNGNTGDYNTGYFCQNSSLVVCFDQQTSLTHAEFKSEHPEYWYLVENLLSDELSWDRIKSLPGITEAKLKSLIAKHKEKRNVNPT